MAATYLDSIVASHRKRAAGDARDWRQRAVAPSAGGFGRALREHRSQGNAVIAEVKRASPSKGPLNANLDPASLAVAYRDGGASAISVLTDSDHFGGSVKDLIAVRNAVTLPILRKDFTVSVNDVLDTAEMGASCVLLIVAALSGEELKEFLLVSRDVGLDALVEVHDELEAAHAIELGASIIGVNQRDLHSFQVDADRARRVAAALPKDVVRVAESGFHSQVAVQEAAAAGFDAVLVGEAFVTSQDPTAAVQSFVGFEIGSS
jgi:indole-3-glycerol phosphate synthase